VIYSDEESVSASAFSFVGIHNASNSKPYSLASNKHLPKTCMEASWILLLAILWATRRLSTCITSAFSFHL